MKGIWSYERLLPGLEDHNRLTLGEGQTPLVKSSRIAAMLGLEHLYFKLEITNPTGSYKDRFAASAISFLKQHQINFCIATSSGNTGSALAAYSAVAGIPCYLILVDGAPEGKLQQMNVYGADTIIIRGFGKDHSVTKDVLGELNNLQQSGQSLLQVSAYCYSPEGMAGVETIAFEIEEALPGQAKHIFSPAGGGGLTLALIKGFKKWSSISSNRIAAKVHCVQPEGNDTIVTALRNGQSTATPLAYSTTSISGLQVPAVLDGNEVVSECRMSGANGYLVSDALVYEMQQQLACMEGIYCEPAGAVALAGVKKALGANEIKRTDHIVCVVTGHGFKDLNSIDRYAARKEKHRFETYTETKKYLQAQTNSKSLRV